MNFTCLAGLGLYAHQYIRYKHFMSASIFINGILYHSHKLNKNFKYVDISFNVLYGSYVTYISERSRVYSLLGVMVYIINTKYKCDLLHVYGVQFPLLLSLEKFLEINNKFIMY